MYGIKCAYLKILCKLEVLTFVKIIPFGATLSLKKTD